MQLQPLETKGVALLNPSVKPSYADVVKTSISRKQGTKAPIQGTKLSSAIKRITLDKKRLYLDSAATYHSMFQRWHLKNIRQVNTVLCGNYNAGVTTTSMKGLQHMLILSKPSFSFPLYRPTHFKSYIHKLLDPL